MPGAMQRWMQPKQLGPGTCLTYGAELGLIRNRILVRANSVPGARQRWRQPTWQRPGPN